MLERVIVIRHLRPFGTEALRPIGTIVRAMIRRIWPAHPGKSKRAGDTGAFSSLRGDALATARPVIPTLSIRANAVAGRRGVASRRSLAAPATRRAGAAAHGF